MNFIKKWIAKMAYEGLPHEEKLGAARINTMHEMLSRNVAAVVAFKINNGYLVRTANSDSGVDSGYTYCADHQAIADYILSNAMRGKLGVQMDLFPKEKEAAEAALRKKPAGLVGQQANFFN